MESHQRRSEKEPFNSQYKNQPTKPDSLNQETSKEDRRKIQNRNAQRNYRVSLCLARHT